MSGNLVVQGLDPNCSPAWLLPPKGSLGRLASLGPVPFEEGGWHVFVVWETPVLGFGGDLSEPWIRTCTLVIAEEAAEG